MHKSRLFYYLVCLGILISLSGCRTSRIELPLTNFPVTNIKTQDSIHFEEIEWRTYFNDIHLTNLIDSAINTNLDLKAAIQRVEIARSGIRFSKGDLFPSIDAQVSMGTTRYAKYTEEFAGNSTTDFEGKTIPNPVHDYIVGITSVWEIDLWGKLRSQRKSAVSNFLASVEGKNFVVSNIIADLSVAYYQLIALDNKQHIINQSIQKAQEALAVVEMQKEVGRANELAVQQFQLQLLSSKKLKLELTQQISETENKINYILGRFPQPIQRSSESLFRELPAILKHGVAPHHLLNRPDIRAAEHEIQASRYDLNAARASFFPALTISTAIGYQAFNPGVLFLTPASLGYTALGSLLAPIINRNALKAQFNTAKANQLTAIYQYQETILNGYIEVINELSSFQTLQELHVLKKQQAHISEQSVHTANELFMNARATYLEVLFTQQNHLEAELELIDINERQKIATVNLYKALGGGWN
jgi:multidrug efflux system outer membrane protein